MQQFCKNIDAISRCLLFSHLATALIIVIVDAFQPPPPMTAEESDRWLAQFTQERFCLESTACLSVGNHDWGRVLDMDNSTVLVKEFRVVRIVDRETARARPAIKDTSIYFHVGRTWPAPHAKGYTYYRVDFAYLIASEADADLWYFPDWKDTPFVYVAHGFLQKARELHCWDDPPIPAPPHRDRIIQRVPTKAGLAWETLEFEKKDGQHASANELEAVIKSRPVNAEEILAALSNHELAGERRFLQR